MTSSESPPEIQVNPAGLAAQLRPVMLLKATQAFGMALFMIAAPRLMGPDRFGQFAVILSVSALWMTTCTLGGRYVFGRFVPEYASRGQTERVRAVFMHILVFRLVVIVAATPLLYAALARLLPEASGTVLALSVSAFAMITAASPMYAAFFGLNRLGVSMSKEALGRYLLLLLLVLLGGTGSLERASLALLLTHLAILIVGVVLARRLFTLAKDAFDVRTLLFHVRFGLAIFAANLLLRLPWRLGEGALAFLGTPAAEIAFFSVALSATVGFARILGNLASLLIPSMSLKQAAGDHEGRDRSLGVALRFLTIAGCMFVLAVLALGPWGVETLLGKDYLPVLPNLYIVALAALFVPYVRCAISLAVVEDRVRFVLRLGLLSVAVFGASVALLVPDYASRGASVAVVLAVVSASVAAVLEIRRTDVLEIARSRRQLFAAAPPAALILWAGPSPLAAVAAAVIYLALLLALRVTSREEIRELLRRIRGAPIEPSEVATSDP